MNPLVLALVVVLVIVALGGMHPGVTTNYGYWPSGSLGLVLIVLLIVLLLRG